jgi:hypothetical protein
LIFLNSCYSLFYDVCDLIIQLETGEAFIFTLDETGVNGTGATLIPRLSRALMF